MNTLIHHCEAVLHLRFAHGLMVTCSKDRSIAVWDMVSPTEINLRRVLVGHRAAVNVVDFDDKYIVSASGDRTIKVWSTATCEFVRTLNGHKRGIACLQYRDRLVVSGSSDNSIRLLKSLFIAHYCPNPILIILSERSIVCFTTLQSTLLYPFISLGSFLVC